MFIGPVPSSIESLIQYVEKEAIGNEGIFRVPGQISEMNKLKDEIDNNISPNFKNYSIHVNCGVLKMYVRDLPEPLLTFERFDDFLGATSIFIV